MEETGVVKRNDSFVFVAIAVAMVLLSFIGGAMLGKVMVYNNFNKDMTAHGWSLCKIPDGGAQRMIANGVFGNSSEAGVGKYLVGNGSLDPLVVNK